jgi:hypothetical protein
VAGSPAAGGAAPAMAGNRNDLQLQPLFDEMLQLPAPSSSGTFDTRESGIQSLVFYRIKKTRREERKNAEHRNVPMGFLQSGNDF